MKYVGKNGLKVIDKNVWHEGNFTPGSKSDIGHKHTKSEITDFPSSLPANGGTASAISFADTRSAVDKPSDLQSRKLTGMFKYKSSVGNPPVGASATYVFILNIIGWNSTEGSGGWPIQIAFGTEGMAYRQAVNADTWGPWKRISNLSDIPTSLPANGGNADTVDGKHASDFATAGHTHDDRYYTESEIDTKLGGKANTSHTHTKANITDFAHTHTAGDLPSGTTSAKGVVQLTTSVSSTSTTLAATASAVKAAYDKGNHSHPYAPTSHTHTKSQITDMPTKLSQFVNDIGAGAGLNIVCSPTEPSLNAGDWWYKEI